MWSRQTFEIWNPDMSVSHDWIKQEEIAGCAITREWRWFLIFCDLLMDSWMLYRIWRPHKWSFSPLRRITKRGNLPQKACNHGICESLHVVISIQFIAKCHSRVRLLPTNNVSLSDGIVRGFRIHASGLHAAWFGCTWQFLPNNLR